MLEFAGINVWAVTTVWLLYVVIGAFWYSPVGFGRQWTKYTGIDIMKKPQSDANKAILFVALSAIVQVLALAVILNSLHVSTVTNGMLVAVLTWLGFTAATTVGVTLYSNKGWKYLWLNSSYFLVVMVLGSIILSNWR